MERRKKNERLSGRGQTTLKTMAFWLSPPQMEHPFEVQEECLEAADVCPAQESYHGLLPHDPTPSSTEVR